MCPVNSETQGLLVGFSDANVTSSGTLVVVLGIDSEHIRLCFADVGG